MRIRGNRGRGRLCVPGSQAGLRALAALADGLFAPALALICGLLLTLLVLLLQPLPARASEWQDYLEDDFSSPESMFFTGQAGEAQYGIDDDGRYIIDGIETGSDSLSALTDSLYYYYYQADCQVLESSAGDLAFCGIVFHYHKLDDGRLAYYVFYMYGDGYYGAKRVIGTDVEILLPLKKTDLFNPDGYTNTLAVDAQGTRFNLYINGEYVDGFTDMQVDGGGFGFYISKNSRGAFDNFKVKTEKRGGGKRGNDEPGIVDDGGEEDGSDEGSKPARGYFEGYHPPDIAKDPDRPIYPWEVGYDKSHKNKKKDAEQRNSGADEEAGADAANGEAGAENAGPDDNDADYIPRSKPTVKGSSKEDVRAPAADESADEGAEDSADSVKDETKDKAKGKGKDAGDDKRRHAEPDKSKKTDKSKKGTVPDSAKDEPRRHAKGGKLEPQDGFRETGGPATPAVEEKDSDHQVRPPQKGDSPPPLLDKDEELVQADDLPEDGAASAEDQREPGPEPDEPQDSSSEMVRAPEGDAAAAEAAGAAGDESGAEQSSDATDGAAAEGATPAQWSEEDAQKAGADSDAETEKASAEDQPPVEELKLKPELPSRGESKGKKGKGKGKGGGRDKKGKGKGKKGSKDTKAAKDTGSAEDEAREKSKGHDKPQPRVEDEQPAGADTAPADETAGGKSGSKSQRHGLDLNGDDWGDSGSSSRTTDKSKSKKGRGSADKAAPQADETQPADDDSTQPGTSGDSDAAPPDNLAGKPTDSGSPAESREGATDGFAAQQDAGLPADAGEGEGAELEAVRPPMDGSREGADSAVPESAETEAQPAADSDVEISASDIQDSLVEGEDSGEEPAADVPSMEQARPPATERPGDQPDYEPGPEHVSPLLGNVNISNVKDDFSQTRWPQANNGSSSYSYQDETYVLDNLQAQTMAISYQQDSFEDCEISIESRFIDGDPGVGYGLAGRFKVSGGAVSYYAAFVSGSGELLLLKVSQGTEIVLADWVPCPQLEDGQFNTITLELVGPVIRASVNGERVAEVEDDELHSGGYALLAGPGVSASFDNLLIRGVRAK